MGEADWGAPDTKVNARETFGIDVNMSVPAFSKANEYVPDLDDAYRFDRETTLAILAGFAFNRRVMVQGYHGTGKSTHIEQVAARLKWPCVRVNLDSHISRIDLIGKDAIVLKDGQQITEFARIRISASSRRRIPSVSATPRASITARSRSIRARWTAGPSSPR